MRAIAFVLLITLLHKLNTYNLPRARFGPREHKEFVSSTLSHSSFTRNPPVPKTQGPLLSSIHSFSTEYRYGKPKPPGWNYTQIMVVPRLVSDDISWIGNELPGIDAIIYLADNPTATLHAPRNKGHEVMIYLTYIIDHYPDLPDTVIFMHAHRWTHHNIELLGHDSAAMVRRLSDEYVAREGYVNLRCRWYPGCPEWLHPNDTQEMLAKQEQVVLSRSWHELFPSESIPRALGQACCAQFALSKDRILSIPLSRFIFYRDWMLRTPLSDYVSGRIWEYLWQYIFTGRSVYCPSEHRCHCEGFGICFGSDAEYTEFEELRRTKETLELELEELREEERRVVTNSIGEREHALSSMSFLDSGKVSNMTDQLEALKTEIETRRQTAVERGIIRSNGTTKSNNR